MGKKITCYFILTLLALIMISCSKETESFDVDFVGTEEIVPDFNGYDFTIFGLPRDGRVELDPYSAYEDSELQDMLQKRYNDIENKYNLNFIISEKNGDLFTYYVAGLPWADLYDDQVQNHISNLNAGLYNSLTYVSGFSEGLDEGKWGTIESLEFLRRGDNYYGFYPAFHGIPFPQMGGILYGNMTILRNIKVNPYEMVENGTWVWDSFKGVLETVNQEYDSSENVIPLYGIYQYIGRTSILSNGGSFTKKSYDGLYLPNFDSPEVREALQWCSDLSSEGLMLVGPYAQSRNTEFIDDLICFMVGYSYVGTVDTTGFIYSDVDFSVLPFPTGPSGTYGSWVGYRGFADRNICIPITANMDAIDVVLSELYDPISDDQYEWKETYSNLNFLYEEGADIYFQMYENSKVDFSFASDLFPWESVLNGSQSVSSAIESSKDVIQETLDKNLNDFIK